MGRIVEITLGGSYTFQAAQYHPIKGEALITMTVDEGEDIEDVKIQLAQHVTEGVIASLAGISVVHDKLYTKGGRIEDLVAEAGGWDDEPIVALEEDDDEEDWGI
jgi:hypothetical protein